MKNESGFKMSKQSYKMYENLALLSQIALMMITPIFGGVLLGRYLDDKVGTNGIFLLVFTLIGTMTAFMELFKLAMRKTKDHPPNKRK
jgi:ATP synthase protein I